MQDFRLILPDYITNVIERKVPNVYNKTVY